MLVEKEVWLPADLTVEVMEEALWAVVALEEEEEQILELQQLI